MKLRINESDGHQVDIDFLNSIDYSPLEDKLSEIVGTQIKLNAEIKSYRGDRPRIQFESQDIRDYCGIFGKILESCVLTTFGTGFFRETDGFWGDIHLSYSHKEGGRNGMALLNYQYSEDNGWQFRVVGEDR